MTTKKELIQNWIKKQKSKNNKNIDTMHQNKIDNLSAILDSSLDHVLDEMCFNSPEVLEGVIASYLDVSEYLRFIAFRFQDLKEQLLNYRIYGLGLHLENMGSSNVFMNPSRSPLVKFGEGLKGASESQFCVSCSRPKIAKMNTLRSSGEISESVVDECVSRLSGLKHGWIRQEIDDWENINERRKFNAVNIERREDRLIEKRICLEMDSVIHHLKTVCEIDEDIRSFLSKDFQACFDEQNNKANLPYIEDLKIRIEESNNPLINKQRLSGMLNQLVLQERISLRGIRPGEKTAPELSVLRDILIGRGIFKKDTNIVEVIRACDQKAKKLLEGRSEFYQKTYAESLKETIEALDYLVEDQLGDSLFA